MDTRGRLTLLALLLWAAAVYAPLQGAPFVYEDAQSLATVVEWQIPGRGLTAWTFQVVGRDAATAHLVNLALHLANGFLVALLASTLAGPLVASGAALVFLLHPLNSEAVSYVTGRADLLVTLFALLSTWFAVQWADRAGFWRLALCGLSLVGAALSKEIGIVAVALVVLTLRVWRPKVPAALLLINGVWLLAGIVVGVMWDRLAGWMTVSGGSVFPWPAFAALQLAQTWALLARVIVPVGFSIDHDVLAYGSTWHLIAGLLTVQALALGIWAWKRAPIVAWGIAWIAICVAPRFVFGGNEFLKEYQLATAMVGVSVLAGVALAAIPTTAPAWRERTTA